MFDAYTTQTCRPLNLCVWFFFGGGSVIFATRNYQKLNYVNWEGQIYKLKKEKYVGFKVLRVTVIKTAVFSDVMMGRYISMGLPPSSVCYKDGGNRRR